MSRVGVVLVVDALGLERREEALGDGVVLAVALAAHARDDAALGERGAVVVARVGAAAVGVVHETGDADAAADGVVERRQGRGRRSLVRSSPSRRRDARRGRAGRPGYSQPCAGRDVRHVADPGLVRRRRLEVAVEEVRRDGDRVLANRWCARNAASAARAGPFSRISRSTRFLPTRTPVRGSPDARAGCRRCLDCALCAAPISARERASSADRFEQEPDVCRCVVAAGRDAEHPAHRGDGEGHLLRRR